MKLLDPEWSAQIDTSGTPRDPLGSDRARNKTTRIFSYGLLTSNTLRLRYLSLFSWLLSELNERETRIEDSDLPRDTYLKNFEKLFALSSQFHRRDEEQDWEMIRGITGVSRLGEYESLSDFDRVEFDDIELQKNDGYGYEDYERVIQKFFLKRGGYELTAAGEALAGATGSNLDPLADDIFKIIEAEEATSEAFESFTPELAVQSVFCHPEQFDDERTALRQVLFGHLGWDGDPVSGTVTISGSGENEALDVLETLETVEGMYQSDDPGPGQSPLQNKLHKNFSQGVHEFRRAFAYMVLRSWTLYESENKQIELTDRDRAVFDPFRKLMRIYWLQVYAGYALEAQLEAITTLINKEHPPRYDRDVLIDHLSSTAVDEAVTDALTALEPVSTTEPADGKWFTRNLILYGSANGTRLDATIEANSTDSFTTIDDVNAYLSSRVEEYRLHGVNEILLSKTIRSALDDLHEAGTADALDHYRTVLGRSIALLLFVLQRYRSLADELPTLQQHMKRQLWTPPGNSVPLLNQYTDGKAGETSLHEFGCELLQDRVIDLHTKVMYERLTPGNLQRLISLDRDDAICLRMDEEPSKRPFTARARFIRFSELNTFLRDAGLLNRLETGNYSVTREGRRWLENVYGGELE
jgi:hypothetical protein